MRAFVPLCVSRASAKGDRVVMRISMPSPPMVIACLALAVSLSGVGWAVTVLPKNSVGTAQLKANAVISKKVKNGSLLAADFKRGQLPAGPAGLQGERGQEGEKGDKGDAGAPGISGYQIVTSPFTANATTFNGGAVLCPSGKKALGGGVFSDQVASQGPYVHSSQPRPDGSGWQATTARSAAGNWTITVFAVCATVS